MGEFELIQDGELNYETWQREEGEPTGDWRSIALEDIKEIKAHKWRTGPRMRKGPRRFVDGAIIVRKDNAEVHSATPAADLQAAIDKAGQPQ